MKRLPEVKPFVKDNRNILLIRPVTTKDISPTFMTSLQHALKKGIQFEFQVEEQEISMPEPDATKYPSVSANVSAEREQLDLANFWNPFSQPAPVQFVEWIGGGVIRVGFVRSQPAAGRRA